LAKKEFIGLTYDKDRIRMARVQVVKGSLMLMEVDTLDLPLPLDQIQKGSAEDLDFSDDYSDIFEIESPKPADSVPLGTESLSEKPKESEDNNFDMTREPTESESSSENEKLLADYLAQFNGKKVRLGIHIPFGKTTFQYLKNTDPGSMRRSEREEFFYQKLQPVQGEGDVNPDDYAWKMVNENDCLLAYNPNEIELINLIELAETYLDGKLLIHERVPDEAIWAGMARANYDLGEDEITGLVAIGSSTSRVVFMQGGEIINMLPVITEGENSDDILNTVFSKILFEIDKGELPKINRLLIVKSARISDKAKKYFQKQFEDIFVDFLTPHPEKVSYADDVLDSPTYLQPYISAIGAAWAASGIESGAFSDFSILPEYIREKLRVLKLEWHGVLILVLIALTPLFLNSLYQQRAGELEGLEQEITVLDRQIDDFRPTATMTQDLLADITEIQGENDRILGLANYSQQWSQTIDLLNEGVFEIPNVWLSTLNTAEGDSNLVFSGQSLTREDIPEFAFLFNDGHILNVTEGEIRGETVYSFSVRVNNILQDLEEFILTIPEPNFDSEMNPEILLDFSEAEAPPPIEGSTSYLIQQLEPEQRALFSYEQNTGNAIPFEKARNELNSVTANHATSQSDQTDGSAFEEKSKNSGQEPEDIHQRTEDIQGLKGNGPDENLGGYTITLHSTVDSLKAKQEYQKLIEEGYRATINKVIIDGRERWRVGVGQFHFVSEALEAVEVLPEPYRNRHFIVNTEEG
jgi:hypothetical protein